MMSMAQRLVQCCRSFFFLNYPMNIYIPDRLLEGYEINSMGLKKISGTKYTTYNYC